MDNEELSKPAHPPHLDENGWPLSSNSGFNKLELASLMIASGMLGVPESWQVLYSIKDEKDNTRTFSATLLGKTAIKIAKTILSECHNELKVNKDGSLPNG